MQPTFLFDLDGLLIDSEPVWDAAKRDVFGPLGLHLTAEMQAATRGMRQRDMVAHWFDRAALRADPDDVEQRIVAAVCRRLADVELKPGAEQAVAACARAARAMAVVSSSPEPVIRRALASTGLDRFFDAVFSAEDDEHGKPHPGAYLRAAAALGASPEECVVLEDSFNGVLAGASARMTVVAVPEAADRSDPRFAIATLVLDSLADLDTSAFGAHAPGAIRDAARASRTADPQPFRQHFGDPKPRVAAKVRGTLHPWIEEFIGLSPFLVMATADGTGAADASPRGGEPGFVRVLDDRHLLIPDRWGNRLFQSFGNIQVNPQVGLVFFIPGVNDTVRVNGTARVVSQDRVLELVEDLRGELIDPKLRMIQGLVVEVEEAYYHCPRSTALAGLWDAARIERHTEQRPLPPRPRSM
ncbi:HAD-IA family hydrolase [Kitasatospora phosalacinea]|uniref:HAD-IA family hydrolase n=1 Tax=Kitasatospora phosalacinea TaxID=2065 RepID=UPI0035DBC7F5